jgi:FkbM family methyltransferase
MTERRRSFARLLGGGVAAAARAGMALFGRGTGARATGYAASVIAPIVKVATGRGELRFSCASYWSAKRAIGFLTQEPETLEWIDAHVRAGDHLWDVGANVGAYALYACLADDVSATCFEPVAGTFAILARNIELNVMGSRIVPLCLALSDADGIVPLYLADAEAGSSMHALGEPTNVTGKFAPAGIQQTASMRADHLAAQLRLIHPDHLKIDVDGHELQVLKGMGQLLGRTRTVLVELGESDASKAEINALLEAHGLQRASRGGRNCLYTNRGMAR